MFAQAALWEILRAKSPKHRKILLSRDKGINPIMTGSLLLKLSRTEHNFKEKLIAAWQMYLLRTEEWGTSQANNVIISANQYI